MLNPLNLRPINNPEKKSAELMAILPHDIYETSILELNDVIAPSALRVDAKSLNLGEKIARTLFVISFPRYLTEEWFSPVINLDKMFDASIFIHPIDTSKPSKLSRRKLPKSKAKF